MTTTESTSDATYVLGHPSGEEQRLQRLGQLQYASTRHLLTQAGIVPGMKVLDVGSGDACKPPASSARPSWQEIFARRCWTPISMRWSGAIS